MAQSAISRHNASTEKRAQSKLQHISDILSIDATKKFHGSSLAFLQKLYKLCQDYEPSDIIEALEESRAARQSKPARGSSRSAQWTPVDVTEAREILKGTFKRGRHDPRMLVWMIANPDTAETPTPNHSCPISRDRDIASAGSNPSHKRGLQDPPTTTRAPKSLFGSTAEGEASSPEDGGRRHYETSLLNDVRNQQQVHVIPATAVNRRHATKFEVEIERMRKLAQFLGKVSNPREVLILDPAVGISSLPEHCNPGEVLILDPVIGLSSLTGQPVTTILPIAVNDGHWVVLKIRQNCKFVDIYDSVLENQLHTQSAVKHIFDTATTTMPVFAYGTPVVREHESAMVAMMVMLFLVCGIAIDPGMDLTWCSRMLLHLIDEPSQGRSSTESLSSVPLRQLHDLTRFETIPCSDIPALIEAYTSFTHQARMQLRRRKEDIQQDRSVWGASEGRDIIDRLVHMAKSLPERYDVSSACGRAQKMLRVEDEYSKIEEALAAMQA